MKLSRWPERLFGHAAGFGGTEAIGRGAKSTNRKDGNWLTETSRVVDPRPPRWRNQEGKLPSVGGRVRWTLSNVITSSVHRRRILQFDMALQHDRTDTTTRFAWST